MEVCINTQRLTTIVKLYGGKGNCGYKCDLLKFIAIMCSLNSEQRLEVNKDVQ